MVIYVCLLKCVVQSYLQWLQDSDYDPTCRLCGKNLTDDGCGKCVRLQCYGEVPVLSFKSWAIVMLLIDLIVDSLFAM